jgi:transcriptional regulator with XRE-family HTH domain
METPTVRQIMDGLVKQVNNPFKATGRVDQQWSDGNAISWGSLSIGEEFEGLRKWLNLSVPDAAKITGLSASTIRKIELGQRAPGSGSIARIICSYHEYTEEVFPNKIPELFDRVIKVMDRVAAGMQGRNSSSPWRGHRKFRLINTIDAIAAENQELKRRQRDMEEKTGETYEQQIRRMRRNGR